MKLNYGSRLKPFAYRPLEQDRPLNLIDGSVRSGKTFSLYSKVLYACQYPVQGWRIMAGVSKASIFRNILNDVFNLVGPRRYNYNVQTGMLKLCGSDWIVLGAGDEGAEKHVRGLTGAVAFVDELTKVPQSFYNMLISRLSPDGSRFYATTNPDNPNHWVKTDIIDNELLHRSGDLFYMQCTMDDNPNLSESYKERMKRQYRGAFYKRFILGEWVTAEGAIYADSWSDDLLYDDEELPKTLLNPEDHAIGIDYGTVNPFAAIEGLDDGQTVWLDREFYYDSAKEQKQLTDEEYIVKMRKWLSESRIVDCHPRLVIDPSAASFRAACISEGWWLKDADNEVIEGIRLVSSVMAARKIRINRKCENLIRELHEYAWDDGAAKRGEEKPRKVNDHACFAAGTEILTPSGIVSVESLKVGDLVKTPLGNAKVLAVQSRLADCVARGNLVGTPEHPVFHCGEWMPFDMLDTCELKPLSSKGFHLGDIQNLVAPAIKTISNRMLGTSRMVSSHYTAKYGNRFTVRYRKAITSITEMVLPGIMIRPILNVCWDSIISPCTHVPALPILSLWKESDHSRKHGTPLQRDVNGIETTLERSQPISRRKPRSEEYVPTVGSNSTGYPWGKLLNSVVTIASRMPGVNLAWTMFPRIARYVAGNLWAVNTSTQNAAPEFAGTRTKVVYALRTEHGCYIANGRLVSNCDALRYMCKDIFKPWRVEA